MRQSLLRILVWQGVQCGTLCSRVTVLYLVLVLAGGSGSHAFLAVPFVCFGPLHILVRCLAPVSCLYCGNGCRAGLHIQVFRGRSCLAPRHGFSAITMQLFCAGPSSLAQYFLIPMLPRSAAANCGFLPAKGCTCCRDFVPLGVLSVMWLKR